MLFRSEVEEAYRGRLGAFLVTGRNVLVSLSALIAASLAIAVGGTVLLLANVAAIVVALLVTGGYRPLAAGRSDA